MKLLLLFLLLIPSFSLSQTIHQEVQDVKVHFKDNYVKRLKVKWIVNLTDNAKESGKKANWTKARWSDTRNCEWKLIGSIQCNVYSISKKSGKAYLLRSLSRVENIQYPNVDKNGVFKIQYEGSCYSSRPKIKPLISLYRKGLLDYLPKLKKKRWENLKPELLSRYKGAVKVEVTEPLDLKSVPETLFNQQIQVKQQPLILKD